MILQIVKPKGKTYCFPWTIMLRLWCMEFRTALNRLDPTWLWKKSGNFFLEKNTQYTYYEVFYTARLLFLNLLKFQTKPLKNRFTRHLNKWSESVYVAFVCAQRFECFTLVSNKTLSLTDSAVMKAFQGSSVASPMSCLMSALAFL